MTIDIHSAEFRDRRRAHRLQVDIPVDLILGDGTVLKVNASNLSLDGLLFSCDDWTSKKIEHRGIQNHPLNHIQISIVANFSKQKKLYANCRIISARRESQDSYVIGLEFIDFQKNSEANLLEYMTSLN